MELLDETIRKLKSSYGEPRDGGYQEFLKTCTYLDPFMSPTKYNKLCKGYILPSGTYLHDIMIQPYYDSRTIQAKDSDVIVDAFPKTGTTWTEEICYFILNGTDPDKVNFAPTEDRIPFLEIPTISIKNISKLPDPRIIKSHLPYEELPPSFLQNKTKIVYIARNPRDTAVSYYHFVKMLGYIQYDGDFPAFLDHFMAGEVMYSSFAKHVLGFWQRRHENNILFIKYEDLKEDFRSGIRKIAEFLGVNLTDEQVTKTVQHCSFDSMSKNPMTNYSQGGAAVKTPNTTINFMRKGKVGDWKSYFTEELNKKMDDYVQRHFEGTGLTFKYEI